MHKRILILTGMVGFVMASCGLGGDKPDKVPDGGFNLFTVQQDRDLGLQVAQEIESNPAEYPILDSASNVAAYKYVYEVRDKVLNSGQVIHKNDFVWRVRIVDNDDVLNAFCTPGGYIYFYTGIIKYLEDESQFAGVMGHEMAHADLRHSTRQMTKVYGVQVLMNVLLGDSSALAQVTTGLVNLKFSRNHETEADHKSVDYLCATDYAADGGAGFFEKIQAEGAGSPPEFLSTHPSPDNRIENYHKWAKEMNCPGKEMYKDRYRAFQALF
ncbi:MAG: M48 family metalloprotease [Crocinitomicaceae bacterium]|nr:M48 family metalloprotease [Crocinitomicaceae bacterium]